MNDIYVKARNFKIAGFFILLYSFFLLTSDLKALFYIPKDLVVGSAFGIYYDNPHDLNSFLSENALTEISTGYQKYYSFNIKTNYIPFLFDDSHSIIYSFDARIPIKREFGATDNSTGLNTYTFVFEFSGFESYLRKITVHPFVGFGYSHSILSIKATQDNNTFLQSISSNQKEYDFKKGTLLFNLGGGIDYRTGIKEYDEFSLNLLFSFNARYSMCLDAWRINDSDWKYDKLSVGELPQYYAPGLSIELGLSLEFQDK